MNLRESVRRGRPANQQREQRLRRRILNRTLNQVPHTRPSRPIQNNLNDIYTNLSNAASYSSNVHEFLRLNPSLSLHKKRRKKFPRRSWIVPGLRN